LSSFQVLVELRHRCFLTKNVADGASNPVGFPLARRGRSHNAMPPTGSRRYLHPAPAAASSPDGDFGRLACAAFVFDWPGRSAGALLTINLSQTLWGTGR
jgi:hypothetical protein